jgi:hypothetical protein
VPAVGLMGVVAYVHVLVRRSVLSSPRSANAGGAVLAGPGFSRGVCERFAVAVTASAGLPAQPVPSSPDGDRGVLVV